MKKKLNENKYELDRLNNIHLQAMREKINEINKEKQELNQEINKIKQKLDEKEQLQNNNMLIDDLEHHKNSINNELHHAIKIIKNLK